MARPYETLFIVDPDLDEAAVGEIVEKVKELITKNGGTVVKTHNWGIRKLAYGIDSQQKGSYQLIDFDGVNETLKKLQRFFLINNQDILRFAIHKRQEHPIIPPSDKPARTRSFNRDRPENSLEEGMFQSRENNMDRDED